MRRIILLFVLYFAGIGAVNAAVRDVTNTINRQGTQKTESVSRSASSQKTVALRTASSNTSGRANQTVVSRTATNNATSRGTTVTARTAATGRAGATVNAARTARSSVPARRTSETVNRAGVARGTQSRAAVVGAASGAFAVGYNECRDAYFTCMDQFCAMQNETYRRCVCSSRLADVQARERALNQTSNQLLDFKSLNISVIDKNASEVSAMLSASAGEAAATNAKDTSASAQALNGISEVLAGTKTSALSSQGKLDIGGDIKSIWATTDFKGGANIANLMGEPLYNAVHAQCVDLVASQCSSKTTLNMVVSAYGMYIENDCAALLGSLDKQLNTTNSTIRATEREMNTARLENYNAHNSSSINDCIANVRADITADTACGANYVHCLDVTGKYLNRTTGEPIYSADFYQLESMTSLAGDILTNRVNNMLVSELNAKRVFAKKSLNLCQDVADDVWDEFLRQAITEIYQGQQSRVRQVKNECLDVINMCYDEQNQQLKDFTNAKEQLLLGSRMELSEEMCREKLDACSNLYGGGQDGMSIMLATLKEITDQKIAQNCLQTLQDYVRELCMVPSNDTLHAYPYSCRIYAPGDAIYANIMECNSKNWSPGTDNVLATVDNLLGDYYYCPIKRYVKCNPGYYLGKYDIEQGKVVAINQTSKCENWGLSSCGVEPGACYLCPTGNTCDNGFLGETSEEKCGDDYVGSLYHKMVKYALQACVRPTESNRALPESVLADVNMVMDSLQVDMRNQLAAECERWGGVWVNSAWVDLYGALGTDLMGGGPDDRHDLTGHMRLQRFLQETSANTKWGYCADPESM